jgi:hypothetical protein
MNTRSRAGFRIPCGLRELAVVAGLVASVAVAAGPAAVSAASPSATLTFGTPRSSSSFGKGIDFTQPYSGGQIDGAAIVVSYEGSFGVSVDQAKGAGSGSLTYTIDTSTGQLQPNTQVTAHFRVSFADGSTQDGPDIHVTYLDDRFNWQTLNGKIVRIHWYSGDTSFAQQALQMGDDGIAKAAQFMGYTETKPVDFYVYPDQAPFYDALGPSTRDNVGGEANTQTRTLFALIAPNELSYAATVVPHELTHVVFDDVTGNPYHSPPHWLNEGIAVYVSQGFDGSDKRLVSRAASDGTLMPLAAISGQFPTQDRFFLAYAEAVSAVDYFMRTYGRADLIKLLTEFGRGASDDEAFTAAIGMGLNAFDSAWQKDNGVTSLKTFGPQPAPTGPVPPGWVPGGWSPASSGPGAGAASAAPGGPSSAPSPTSGASKKSGDSEAPILPIVLGGGVVAVGLVLVAFTLLRRSGARGPR